MFGRRGDREIGYRIEVTLLGGTLRLEESGKVTADYKVSEEEIRRAEEEVRRSLEKVYELVMGRVGTQVVQKVVAKAVAQREDVKAELKRESVDIEGRWMLRIGEAAQLVGVSRSKMYVLVASGQVPSVTIGSSRRIHVKAFREWMDKQTRE